MYKIIWVIMSVIAVLILLWFCWLVFQLSELVACSNVPFNELTADCVEVMK